MRTFKDNKDREWTVDLNLGVAYAWEQAKREVQERMEITNPTLADVDISLLTPEKDDQFMKAIVVTHVLLKLSWLCVTDRRDCTEMEYLAGFKGNTIAEVQIIMMEELADFFPQMAILFLKLRDAQKILARRMKKRLEQEEGVIEEKLGQFLDKQMQAFEESLGPGETSG